MPGEAENFIFIDDRSWPASSADKSLGIAQADTWSDHVGLCENPDKTTLTALRKRNQEDLSQQCAAPAFVQNNLQVLGTTTVDLKQRSNSDKESKRLDAARLRARRIGFLHLFAI